MTSLPCYSRRRVAGRRGFTIIEMIVVIIIITVMSSIVVPLYSRLYASADFQGSVGQVKNLLDYARSAAIEYQSDTTLEYDAQSGTFVVTVQPTTLGADQPTALSTGTENTLGSDPTGTDTVVAPDPRTFTIGHDITVERFEPLVDPSRPNPLPATASTTGGTPITFHDDGSADGGQIVLRSADGQTATLEIAPATGRATVTDDQER